jgi:uncharacterized protein YgiM (DUF1202 family)
MCRVRLAIDSRVRCAALLLLTVGTSTTLTASETPYEAMVISPGAPVRSGPGDDFYPTDTLAQNEVIEVHRVRPDGWLAIRPPADSFSWLFAKHVKLLENGLARVEKDDVASRVGSRMSDQRNAVQIQLKKGEVVEIIGEQTQDGQNWYKIAPPAGEFRWIHTRHVAREDAPAPAQPAAPAVVTVPIAAESTVAGAAPITLVADSQPASEDTWRAAPPDAARVSSDAASSVLPGSLDPARPTAAASSPSTTTPAPISDDLSRRLADVELRLSRTVCQPPATWQIEPLQLEAKQLLTHAQSVPDRAAVETMLAKIERFAAIDRRYRQLGPLLTTRAPQIGQQPITPIPDATAGVVGPDGQRYDAVGILRPVVSKRAGAPQFALLNERGQVVSFVTPTPDVNLQPYVGHQIGVTGTRGYIPEFQRTHVTAGRVAPLGERLLR